MRQEAVSVFPLVSGEVYVGCEMFNSNCAISTLEKLQVPLG